MTATETPDKPGGKKNARGRRRKHTARLTTGKRPQPAASDSTGLSRGEVVRNAVRRAALECFGAFGFEGTSTRAVAERAEVSHSLLLYHFGSKDQLWQATMDDVLRRYTDALDLRLAAVDADDPVAGVREFVAHFVRFSAQVPQLHRVMTQQSTQGSERIGWLLDNYLRSSFEKICAVIGRGQAVGRIRAGEPGRVYYAIIGLGGTLLSVSTEYRQLTGRDVFTEPEIVRTIQFIEDFLFLN